MALAGVIFLDRAAVPLADCPEIPECHEPFDHFFKLPGCSEERGVMKVWPAAEIVTPRDDTGSDSDDIREWGHLLLEREGLAGLVAVSSMSIALAVVVLAERNGLTMDSEREELVKVEGLSVSLTIMALGPAGGLTAVESSSSLSPGMGSMAAFG